MSRHTERSWWQQEDMIEKIQSEHNCKELGLPTSQFKHISVQDENGRLVAYCGCHEQTAPNATLISAAPDLLAACRMTLADISEHNPQYPAFELLDRCPANHKYECGDCYHRRTIEAAIAKAKEESEEVGE